MYIRGRYSAYVLIRSRRYLQLSSKGPQSIGKVCSLIFDLENFLQNCKIQQDVDYPDSPVGQTL
ncbi:hypothetical protein M513_13674 [Trichuris suis]|uniref:Uncharacterized protein n=1 Tax=Trichuris suis TaxID=68888 RepID=A0A085LKF6_9BILA|nr:hypothetical protein M513_13674 [Trichuris suis]